MYQYKEEWPPYPEFIMRRIKDPQSELGDKWVHDDKLPKFVNVYLPSTIEYMGNAVFIDMQIDGLFLPEGMYEVDQLPEFDGTFADLFFIQQIYVTDGATEDQIDALDEFFLQFDEVKDVVWWFEEGFHPCYANG